MPSRVAVDAGGVRGGKGAPHDGRKGSTAAPQASEPFTACPSRAGRARCGTRPVTCTAPRWQELPGCGVASGAPGARSLAERRAGAQDCTFISLLSDFQKTRVSKAAT